VPALLFPDNTVLVNFGVLGRVDLFAELVDGRGSWTSTIAEECGRSSREPGLESLARMREILGEPLAPSRRERVDLLVIRAELAAPGDPATKHLGEAEAIAIITGRALEAAFFTDDRAAAALAARHGIRVYTTAHLILLAVRSRRINGDTGWDLVTRLRAVGRRTPGLPSDRTRFDVWIAG